MSPAPQTRLERSVWWTALFCFVLASLTGVLLRYGFAHGLPFALVPGDVRHSHSHLMFFGWVTPVLMLFLLRQRGGPLHPGLLITAFVFALASWWPFLVSGYGMMTIFGRYLPVSMIVSGLNGLVWYAFIAVYWAGGRTRSRSAYGSAATGLLLASSAGVLALAYAGMTSAGPVYISAFAQLFLDLFAEGWFGLGLLAVAYSLHPELEKSHAARTGLVFIVIGLLLRCTADVFVSLGFTALTPLALAGSASAGLGLLAALLPLWRSQPAAPLSLWHLAYILLGLKAGIDLLSSQPLAAAFIDGAALRVFFLHAYLLGAITLGLVAAARSLWGSAAFRLPWLLAGAALVMTGSLLPLSLLWPVAWRGQWALELAWWLSMLPLAAVIGSLLAGLPRRVNPSPPP